MFSIILTLILKQVWRPQKSLSSLELFQKAEIWFPVHRSGSSKLPVTQAPGAVRFSPLASVEMHSHAHNPHTHTA